MRVLKIIILLCCINLIFISCRKSSDAEPELGFKIQTIKDISTENAFVNGAIVRLDEKDVNNILSLSIIEKSLLTKILFRMTSRYYLNLSISLQ